MKAKTTSTLSLLLGSILGGEVITLLTGLVPNTPAMLVGAVHYGYPLPWLLRLVIAPWYNPWRIDLTNFIADIIIWFAIVAIAAFVVTRLRKPASQ